MVTLILNNGSVLIDAEDLEKINKFHWFVNSRGYVVSSFYDKNTKKVKQQRMHRFIMEAKDGEIIDHKDRNKLNNQKENLHFVSQAINMLNRGKPRNNKSGHTGVSWEAEMKKWRAQITINRKQIYLGMFINFDLAVRAREQAETIYHTI